MNVVQIMSIQLIVQDVQPQIPSLVSFVVKLNAQILRVLRFKSTSIINARLTFLLT